MVLTKLKYLFYSVAPPLGEGGEDDHGGTCSNGTVSVGC